MLWEEHFVNRHRNLVTRHGIRAMPCSQAAQGRLDGLAPSDCCRAALDEWPADTMDIVAKTRPMLFRPAIRTLVRWDGIRRGIEFFGLNLDKNQSKEQERSNAADAIRSKQNMSRLCFVFLSCVGSRVRSMKMRCILRFNHVRHAGRRLKLSTNYFPPAMENLKIVAHEVEERRGALGSHELFSGQKSIR